MVIHEENDQLSDEVQDYDLSSSQANSKLVDSQRDLQGYVSKASAYKSSKTLSRPNSKENDTDRIFKNQFTINERSREIDPVEMEEKIQKKVQEQEVTLLRAHKTDLKNQRALVMKDASNFIRERTDQLLKSMSKEHRHNAAMFKTYRDNTSAIMDRMDCYYKFLIDSELELAQRNPLTEAEYQFFDRHAPLKVFDCYLPVLRKYLKSKTEFKNEHFHKNQLEKRKEDTFFIDVNQRLRKEIAQLEEENGQLKEELSTLNWYIDIYEKGHDKVTLLKEVKRLEEKI